jgi:all-trans-8'-apo-beta-carotenal 15,15'-oxygenase
MLVKEEDNHHLCHTINLLLLVTSLSFCIHFLIKEQAIYTHTDMFWTRFISLSSAAAGVQSFVLPCRQRLSTDASPPFFRLKKVHASAEFTTTTTTVTTDEQSTQNTSKHDQPWILNPQYAGDYDQDRDWGFVYSSVPEQASGTYEVTEIEGDIPSDLFGTTYYKIGPGKFERNGKQYEHVLDGDGFVVSFRIDKNGKVTYTGRFVETEYYQREEDVNKVCYRNVFGTQPLGGPLTNMFNLQLKNVANTNILAWGSRLFALWEAGRPYELDPITLETLPLAKDGPFANLGDLDCNLRGVTIDNGLLDKLVKVGRFFTAHPHVVDENTLVAFNAAQNPQKQSMDMEFLEYDRHWNVKNSSRYQIPDATAAPHDFAVGEEFYGFIQNKIDVNTLPYLLGMKGPAQVMQLQLKQDAILHLVPRTSRNKEKAIQVAIPPYFAIHNLARLEESEDLVTMYSNGWDLQDSRFFPRDKESVPFLGSWSGQYPDFDVVTPAKFFKTIVNCTTETLVSHEEIMPGMVMEFQSQDEKDPKFSYISISTYGGESIPGVGIARVNVQSHEVDHWWAENKIFTGEVLPVPKENTTTGSWLVGLIYDSGKRRTSLAILDSERISEGPVARIHLPHHVSYGLHSTICRNE